MSISGTLNLKTCPSSALWELLPLLLVLPAITGLRWEGVVTLEIRGRVLGTDSTLNRGFRAPGGLWVQKRFGGSLGRCSAGPLQAAVRVRHGPLFPGRLMARHTVLVRVIEVRVLVGEPLIHTSPPISVGAGVLLPLFVKLFCTSSTFISTAEQRTLNP